MPGKISNTKENLKFRNITHRSSRNTPPPLSTDDVYKIFQNTKASGIGELKDITVGNKNVSKVLGESDSNAAKFVKQKIEGALSFTDDTARAEDEYLVEIPAINKALSKTPSEITFNDVDSHIQKFKTKTSETIDKQCKAEINALKALFEDRDFKKNLVQSTGISEAPNSINAVKDAMIKSLEASHEKAKTEALKPLEDSHQKLHKDEQKELNRISYFAQMYSNNKEFRKQVDKIAAEKAARSNVTVELTQSHDTSLAIFRDLKVQDIENLQTITGRPLQQQKDGSFSMELPRKFLSPLFYSGNRNRLKQDMQSIAMAIKAGGHTHITMDITSKDPDHAKLLAREAYEACRLSGFDSDKITIKVNGQERKLSAGKGEQVPGLFTGADSLHESIEKSAQSNQKFLEECRSAKASEPPTKAFRDKMASIRDEQRAKMNVAQPDTPRNTGPAAQ
jgi:hypothetical protein